MINLPSSRPEWWSQKLPNGLPLLRGYQQRGAEWMLAYKPTAMRGRLLADPPGFGKTRTALAAIRLVIDQLGDQPNIVVTTGVAVGDWAREAAKFWPDLRVYVTTRDEVKYRRVGESEEDFERRRFSKLDDALHGRGGPWLIVTSYESAYKILERVESDALLLGRIIVDEAHNMKRATSAHSRVVQPLIARAAGTSLLTGTPIHNRPVDLHNLLSLLNLRLPGRFKWAERYFRIHVNNYGREIGALINKELLAADIASYVLARDVAEAYGELPPRIREVIRLPKPADARLPRVSPSQLQTQTGWDSALRAYADHKIGALVERVVQMDEPCVIYTYKREHADAIAKKLNAKKFPAVTAHGDVTPQKRDQIIELWKAGSHTAIVCTMDAVRESATLVRASAMHFLDFDWLPGKMIQNEGRIDPSRQPENERRPARYYYYAIEGGTDEVVAERLVEKIEAAQGVVTGTGSNAWSFRGTLMTAANKPLEKETPKEAMADLIARLNLRESRLRGLFEDD